MSNSLGIAMVTEALRQLVAQAVSSIPQLSSAPEVRAGRPEKAGPTFVGVNLYLYQLSPNAALRNSDLPTRFAPDGVMQRPAAALDLDFLLSFHGDENRLEPHRLAGAVVAALHAFPMLTPEFLRRVILTLGPESPLAASDLASDPLLVKVSPLVLSLEELSKIWTVFFQASHTLSAAYRASVVALETPLTPLASLPATQRPFTAAAPTAKLSLTDVLPNELPYSAGAEIVLKGVWAGPGDLAAEIGGVEVSAEPTAAGELHVLLPEGVPAGAVPVRIVRRLDEPGPGATIAYSNARRLLIQPSWIEPPVYDDHPPAGGSVIVRLAPAIGALQKIELSLKAVPGAQEPGVASGLATPRRFPLSPALEPQLQPGVLAPTLRAEMERLHLAVDARTTLRALQPGRVWLVVNRGGERFVIRRSFDGVALYAGLPPRAYADGIAFAVERLPAGQYLACMQVNDLPADQAALRPADQPRYVAPILEVPTP